MRVGAMLWKKLDGRRVQCYLCEHRCKIADDGYGFCGMRQNIMGELYTYAYGKVIANNVDPIEKKPLYHFLPGTKAYSVATVGCNFRCSFCQNWTISQLTAKNNGVEGIEMTPEEIVEDAVRHKCKSISYTYTEPTIFFEYAYETAKIAKKNGLRNTFVTNGFMTPEAIEKISPYLDAANIDLKFFSHTSYQEICKGSLKPVLDSIRKMKETGIWVEVTTLIVPGKNDSEEELREIARFLARTGTEIPWHISRFHPDYKYADAELTPIVTMEEAKAIGREEGLKYIYLGNVSTSAETFCPDCGETLIERAGFLASVTSNFLEGGKCACCGAVIEGVW